MIHALRHIFVVALAAASLAAAAPEETAAPPAPDAVGADAADGPSLVVLLVVDQMRADYLDRFAPVFEHGLARFVREGLSFREARHAHSATATGPGHATIATGADPAVHGITANALFDRATRTFHRAAIDPDARSFAGDEPGASGRDLLVDALGDWLKRSDPRVKVAAASWKSRSAALLAGRAPDACVYADRLTGAFTTSTAYAASMPPWLAAFRDAHPPAEDVARAWEPRLDDATFERLGCTADRVPWEGTCAAAEGPDQSAFPHRATQVSELVFTPFADARTLDVALAMVTALGLGADDAPDLLLVSLSAADYIGHAYGPASREVADYYAWLDVALGAFVAAVEEASAARGAMFVLTADHGVHAIAEQAQAEGIAAWRVQPDDVAAAVDAALDETFGAADWVLGVDPDVYVDPALVAERAIAAADLQDAIVAAAKRVRGIETAYPRRLLLARDPAVPDAFLRSFHPERSGDVALALAPHCYIDYLDKSPYVRANHSTHHDADQRVPAVFLGAGVDAGACAEPFATADIAPTIARRLGIDAPASATGRAHALSRPAAPVLRGGER